MATKKGVWNLQQVRDKQLQDLWGYQVGQLWSVGRAVYGNLAQNGVVPNSPSHAGLSSPVQIGSDSTWSMSEYGDIKGNSNGDSNHAIKSDGTLWTWGMNEDGAFGIPSYSNNDKISSPVQVGSDTTWKNTISTSMSNTTRGAIKTDGTLWMWGMGEQGTLGLNQPHNTKYSSPVQIPGTTWKMLSTSDSTNGAVKTDGTLWMWGDNQSGQLAQNNTTQRSSPVQIPGTTWNYLHCGYGVINAIKTDGTLWVWGSNYRGRLGLNQAPAAGTAKYSSPVQVPGTTWKMTDGGNLGYTLAIKTDGTMWSWGYNDKGVLGLNSTSDTGTPNYSSPTQIPGTTWSFVACEVSKSNYALRTDGTLWSWGYQYHGQLGQNQGGGGSRSSPIQIPGSWSGVFAGRDDGFLYKG